MMETKAMMRCSIWSYFWTATSASTANAGHQARNPEGPAEQEGDAESRAQELGEGRGDAGGHDGAAEQEVQPAGNQLRQASARHSPVTMPRWAAMCWRRMSMSVDSVMTQRRLYPNWEPPAILVAQLPGSMNPTVTRNPGPQVPQHLPVEQAGRGSAPSRAARPFRRVASSASSVILALFASAKPPNGKVAGRSPSETAGRPTWLQLACQNAAGGRAARIRNHPRLEGTRIQSRN